jgi:iron complex outermembrane receptor protein
MLNKTFFYILAAFSFIFNDISGQTGNNADTLIRLKEFEVTDFMGKKVYQPADTVGMQSISKVVARDIGDLLRSQSNISGIRKGGSGIDPVVRGFKYSQLNVQVNEGQKIESACPNRMDPPTAHLDVDDIQKIEIFKGPYALRFGPNFGGVVHLHTWPENRTDSFTVNVLAATGYESAWNGMKQHLAVTGGNRYFLLKLSGNYKKYGDYQDGNGNTVPSSFKRYNYNGLLIINPWEKHTFTASYDYAVGENLDFPALPMDERLDNTNLYSLDYVFNNTGKVIQGIHFKGYQSNVHHEMDSKQRPVSDTTVAISIIDAINTGYRAEISLNVAHGTFHVGTDMEDIRKDGDRVKYMIMQPTMPVKNEKLWDNARIQNFGGFAEYSRIINKLTGVASVRLDLNQANSNALTSENMQGQTIYSEEDVESSFVNFSFSLGVDWLASKNLVFGFYLGRGVRSPDMTERFIILLPIGYDNYDYLGNPALVPEKNHQADMSVKWTIPSAGMVKGNIFYSYVTDYITGQLVPESVVKPQTKGVYGVKQFINTDKAWFTGFEIEYHSPVKNNWLVDIIASYTYAVNPLATHYIIENGQITGSEEVKNDPISEIPPLEGTLRFSWKFFDGRLIPLANLRAVAAQNRISEAYNERKSEAFVLAGLSLFYQFNKIFEISAGVDNLFDKAYYEHLNRNIIGSQADFYEPGRNVYVTLRFRI